MCSLDIKAAEEPLQSLDRHLRQHHHHQHMKNTKYLLYSG